MQNTASINSIAAAITSQTGKARLPTHISLAGHDVGLYKDSVVLLEQIRTIDKKRLGEKMGHLDDSVMRAVDTAITVSFGLQSRGDTGNEGNGGTVAFEKAPQNFYEKG